jgi:hypothetical protein
MLADNKRRPKEATRPGTRETSTHSSCKTDHETKANAGQGKLRCCPSCWTVQLSRANDCKITCIIAWSRVYSLRPLAHTTYASLVPIAQLCLHVSRTQGIIGNRLTHIKCENNNFVLWWYILHSLRALLVTCSNSIIIIFARARLSTAEGLTKDQYRGSHTQKGVVVATPHIAHPAISSAQLTKRSQSSQ